MKHINQEMYIESRKDKYINRYSFLFLHFIILISFLVSHHLYSLDNIQITECHVAILNQELNKKCLSNVVHVEITLCSSNKHVKSFLGVESWEQCIPEVVLYPPSLWSAF